MNDSAAVISDQDGVDDNVDDNINDIVSASIGGNVVDLRPELLGASATAADYQFYLECIGDGFVAIDTAGLVTYVNGAAVQSLERERAVMLGRPITSIFPGLSADMLAGPASSNRAPASQVLVHAPTRDRQQLFELNIHRQERGIGILFRDVQDRARHEMEIARLNATMAIGQELLRAKNNELNTSLEQLAKLNDQLAETDRLKSEFLANTSHELRTPLNSIIGFLQLISEGLCENPEEEKQYVLNALASAKHLLSLINDVLDIAKIEAGKLTLLIDDIDLHTVFGEIQSLTHVQAHQKMLKLIFDQPPAERSRVRADVHKLKQILINLIGNAIKFTDHGHVKIAAVIDPENSDMMRISVEDTGIGVPPEQADSVFEKFVQLDGSSTRKHQGTGLGLTITKNLVELMGGNIVLTSRGIGCGSCVTFTLPLGSGTTAESQDDLDWQIGGANSF